MWLKCPKTFWGHCIQRKEVETDKKRRKTVKSGQEFVSVRQVQHKCWGSEYNHISASFCSYSGAHNTFHDCLSLLAVACWAAWAVGWMRSKWSWMNTVINLQSTSAEIIHKNRVLLGAGMLVLTLFWIWEKGVTSHFVAILVSKIARILLQQVYTMVCNE